MEFSSVSQICLFKHHWWSRNQRWANTVLVTEYEYKCYLAFQKWPNTNIQFVRIQIRIPLFGVDSSAPLMFCWTFLLECKFRTLISQITCLARTFKNWNPNLGQGGRFQNIVLNMSSFSKVKGRPISCVWNIRGSSAAERCNYPNLEQASTNVNIFRKPFPPKMWKCL